MRARWKVWSFLVAAVAGVLSAGAGWALAASTNARPVNAQIVANFAQFRRARTPTDALPESIPGELSCSGPFSEGGARYAYIQGLEAFYQVQCFHAGAGQPRSPGRRGITGLQRDQSRAVQLPGRLGTIWLIPWGRWLCNLLRSRILLGAGGAVMACEPISEVLAHPPLWNGGMWTKPSAPASGDLLLALEPDRVTKVTLGYPGGHQPTYLANNVLGACIGANSLWLEQTGPTINGAIKTLLGGGGAPPKRYRPRKCAYLLHL